MSRLLKLLPASVLLGAAATALGNGGGAMPAPSAAAPRVETPQQKAHALYNDGVRYVKKADKAQSESDQATDASRKDKAARDAHDRYASSLEKFQQAVELDPQLYEGWNYVGYTSRRLGHYDDALAAYDKALALKPGYPDAIEYRGEAYLAVKRISDAQQAYLDLFAGNRALADKLLAAMKAWVAAQRASAAGTGAAGVDELDKWIQERAQIAGQTAALTRAGAAASWR
ncbi:MAG TPA: tetratricopeptide repeat protein [Steroidobacteraceae bacterium]|jgi:tetratricopeptide (TPR) repeat protein|nr:tetratricopeptide repeat protein [Steroidobacteraceae bacterium]